MALTREQRRAMLASELSGEAVDVQDVDTIEPTPATKPAAVIGPESATPVALTPDMAGLIQALAAAIQAGNSNIGAQMAEAIKANRAPIPENPPDQYPGVSVYHLGGKDAPFEDLHTDMFLGVWDQEQGKALPAFPYIPKLLTDQERAALNTLTSGVYTVAGTDGTKWPVRVVVNEDAQGTPMRLIVAFPQSAFDKDHRNTIPGPVSLASQLTAA